MKIRTSTYCGITTVAILKKTARIFRRPGKHITTSRSVTFAPGSKVDVRNATNILSHFYNKIKSLHTSENYPESLRKLGWKEIDL